jgi:hypothetical protein
LLHVVFALGPAGRLTRRLHGREEQCDEDRDDRDHHQQLDERKALLCSPHTFTFTFFTNFADGGSATNRSEKNLGVQWRSASLRGDIRPRPWTTGNMRKKK